jgi:hypothetical protein
LRLSLALLILALAGVTVGAALLLGSGQEDPVEAADDQLIVAGPPLVNVTSGESPTAFEGANPGMRLGILDKEQAIREEREARQDARALRVLAAQQAAIYEYAAALEDAQAAEAAAHAAPTGPPPSTPAPTVTDGGGGGHQPPPPNHDGDPLYVKLDNIATCESNQNPRAVSPDRRFWGAFQFLFETWQTYGGGGNRPRDILNYSYAEQREVAARLAQALGFAGPWPTCAARYGYT